ncbi:MAG: efflux RND transporter periplasmic adaptor subunit [Desulfatiglans sp.]|nr:efflux RND transporter periplasmic adaptor subunit [Desulfatiglans sp.]
MKMNQSVIGVLLIICIAFSGFLSGCSRDEGRDDKIEFLVPVTVSTVGKMDVEEKITATGTLRTTKVARLEVETGGILEFLTNKEGRRYREGDSVKAGDVIARITGDDVRLAARKEATLQRFETAKDEYESTKKLYDDGFKSRAELLKMQSGLEDARIDYEKSLNAEKRSQLTTPIDGIILRLARDRDNQSQPIAVGQYVNPGFEVARIAPTDILVADVDLVAQDVARVTEGLPARVKNYAWKNEEFNGRVVRLDPVIDPVTRALKAEIEVENHDAKLRPGMFVEVTIIREQKKDVPAVPREAVVNRGGKWVVFVLSGQRVVRKDVLLGLGDDNIVEIREGLSGGERVVTRGLETLEDQTRVRVTGTN